MVWSNSGEQLGLRSGSPPPLQQRKSDEETGVTNEMGNCGATGPGMGARDGVNVGANDDTNENCGGQETGVEGATAGVP